MAGLNERLVFFDCGGTQLAGVLSIPTVPNGRVVLIPWGSGAFPSSGPNRIRATLARALVSHGFHAFRFDYRGVGESGGVYQLPDLAKPNALEIKSACTWLSGQGLDRVVIVGNCFGGWSALMASPEISGLEALVMINAPVGRDHTQVKAAAASLLQWVSYFRRLSWKRLRNATNRARYSKMIAAKTSALVGRGGAKEFITAVSSLVDRRIPLLLVYGEDDFLADLEIELDRGLRRVLLRAGPPTDLTIIPERLEGYASSSAQKVLVDRVTPWLVALANPTN